MSLESGSRRRQSGPARGLGERGATSRSGAGSGLGEGAEATAGGAAVDEGGLGGVTRDGLAAAGASARRIARLEPARSGLGAPSSRTVSGSERSTSRALGRDSPEAKTKSNDSATP